MKIVLSVFKSFLILFFVFPTSLFAQKTTNNTIVKITIDTIHFPSKDGLQISATSYTATPTKTVALLCHQARFSRGEYKKTAGLLALKGISCLAIDQRSGDKVNDIINETALRAKEKKLATNYLDAKQDIEVAIDYAYKLNGNKPILLVGSSYSASLSLLIGSNSDKVKAIAVFSPGEYLKGIDLAKSISGLKKPVFITAAKNEIPAIEKLLRNVDKKYVTLYKPSVKGFHGSKALWKSNEGNEAYWQAFDNWLYTNYPDLLQVNFKK